ncbi:selenocysteine-specific translation elongation factor [uncultured Cetobacterium sp.]|uniref:selenocysteine-specific translation elongation factor n=1 Tax=uncultured Cetobacterium sp. TaxID=527638 RepID=UPI0026211568|nr:selenocysteine-specific translation elongation factor [uncultured Cetobacterium sp.]
MNNIIIGTAGHIDHGKTTLVKHLTNINTDTMKEEKERGMTIDLGFAPLIAPDGKTFSIIDVPGHEKFIKNMVAGVKGIDFVLFLIACDDGIMPQTVEHKEILKLLGIHHGIIVLSKRDLVSFEEAEQLKVDITNFFDDGFFKSFPVVEVSNKDETSYTLLYEKIIEETSKIQRTNPHNHNFFRLDIDKIYSPKGVGTIVSGTSEGSISKGDFLTLYPSKVQIRIKGIQTHGKSIDTVTSHQRCAFNITNINAKDIERGNLLTNHPALLNTRLIDVLFTPLTKKILPKNNTKIRLNIATGEYFGKIKYLHDNIDKTFFFQLIMDKEIPVNFGDIGIIRSLENSSLLGGVRILNTLAMPTKKNNPLYLKKLELLCNKDEIDINEYLYHKNSFISLAQLNQELNANYCLGDFNTDILILQDSNIIIHKDVLSSIKNHIFEYISLFHEKNPLKHGLSIATLKNKFFLNKNTKEFNDFLIFLSKDTFKIKDGSLSLSNFKIKLSKDDRLIKDTLLIILKNQAFKGLELKKIEASFIDKKRLKDILFYLLSEGLLIEISNNTYILKGFFKEALNRLNLFFMSNTELTLSEFRNILGSNREAALMYLEYFDFIGITKKVGTYRIFKNIDTK